MIKTDKYYKVDGGDSGGKRAVAALAERPEGWYFFDLGWMQLQSGHVLHFMGKLVEETETEMAFAYETPSWKFRYVLTELTPEDAKFYRDAVE